MRSYNRFGYILLMANIFMFLNSSQASGQKEINSGKTIMLILGSADLATTRERVEIGYELYESKINFDYIIVSGGCGAHDSSICEASEMASLLIKKGIPRDKIYREEKSASTVQNYCFSRILKKEDGSRLMNPNDNLYVVSNHWHAIPVAARFRTYDKLNATYYVHGNIPPTAKDKVDYTNIYNHKLEGEDFCESALWPQVMAGYSNNRGEMNLVLEEGVYQGTSKVYKIGREGISNRGPGLPAKWEEGIDAAFYVREENKIYFFKGPELLRFSPDGNGIEKGYPILLKNWIYKAPEDWPNSYVDSAFYNPVDKKVYLFSGENYVKGSLQDGRLKYGKHGKIRDFIENWPFEWGTGNLDAAYYDQQENKLFLFRGQEFMSFSLEGSINADSDFPKNTALLFPDH